MLLARRYAGPVPFHVTENAPPETAPGMEIFALVAAQVAVIDVA
jgi:hypothetical protein